jgi:tetratricopeptide (TPR) repeat protein
MFVRLIATNATGALRVAGDRKMLRALVRDSDLIDVHSTHLRDQTLGRHLRTQSVITEEMEENAFALSIDLRVPYGQALMMLGALNRDQLVQHLTNHKVAKLTRVFAPEWSPAHLEFTPARADRRLEGMKPSALTEILYSGVMKTAAHKDVYDTFVRTNRMTRQMTLSKDFADIARLLRLPADDLARAKRFAGHTIQEVGTLNPMDFAHNLRLAFLLAAAKAIAFRPASAEDRRALDEDLGPLTAATPPEEREILPCDFEAFQRAVVVAEALLTERNYREARERLRLACDINPHSSHALALLAWTEFMLGGRVNPGLCQDLKEMLKNAIALDDCNALAYLYLGKILREEGKHGLAMGVLTRAAQLNPMHREIRMEMAGAKRT